MAVLADVFRPSSAGVGIKVAYDVLLVVGGSVFTALMARLSLPLPFTPVPITGQTLAVLLGGYLLGFVFAAGATGWLAQRGWDRRVLTALLAMATGNVVIYLFGLPWLAAFVGPERAVSLGFIPFIPGDVVKLFLAAALLPVAWRLVPAEAKRD